MKKEINALLLLIAFPILYIGGCIQNSLLSVLGILLTAFNAILVTTFTRKSAKAKKKSA